MEEERRGCGGREERERGEGVEGERGGCGGRERGEGVVGGKGEDMVLSVHTVCMF